MRTVRESFDAFIGRLSKPVFITLALIMVLSSGSAAFEYRPADADKVLSLFYSENLIRRMKEDAKPIIARFSGCNLFSCSQYGSVLIVGHVDVEDIFDARIPQNMKILKDYARENNLVQNVKDFEYYQRYAVAANRFLKEYRFDAVLFYPDEFNPVFTGPADTWMYIREEPLKKAPGSSHYYSGRFTGRHMAVEGGIAMEQCAFAGLHYFYVPVTGSVYSPFRMVESEIIEGSLEPSLLNPYTKPAVDEEIKQKRRDAGIVPSPLSGRRGLKVATWGQKDDGQYKVGFRFSGDEKIYTWGDSGIYTVPLSPDFCRIP